MYCSNSDDPPCVDDGGYVNVRQIIYIYLCTLYHFVQVRTGLPFIQAYGLETMFAQYGVDLQFWAHEHSYERMWPVYNWTVCSFIY